MVSRLQPWKTPLQHGCGEIIPPATGELQKILRHDRADRVNRAVLSWDFAITSSCVPGEGIDTTGNQGASQNVSVDFREHRNVNPRSGGNFQVFFLDGETQLRNVDQHFLKLIVFPEFLEWDIRIDPDEILLACPENFRL